MSDGRRQSALGADELPIKVVVVDVEQMPAEISAVYPDGGRYRGLWVLARCGGRPRRLIRLGFSGDSIAREEIERDLYGLDPIGASSARPPLPNPPPRISVVVCSSLSREDDLRAALESISGIAYPDFEVLVVDNRPDDRVAPFDWLGRLEGVQVLREPRPGLSAARNRALRAATGSLIAFTDDDVVVDEGWLDAIARRFGAHPDEACVTGLVLPKGLDTPAQAAFEAYYDRFGPRVLRPASNRLERPRTGLLRSATMREVDDDGRIQARFSLYGVGRVGGGANMAFRTAVLREAGGFDVTLGAGTPALGGEDIGMFARLAWRGHSIGYEPAALAFHRHRDDNRALTSQIESYGLGFIAMFLALIGEDRRHLGALIATTPLAMRRLSRSYWRKLRTMGNGERHEHTVSTISELARIELRGMAKGPAAYLSSWRRARRFEAGRQTIP